MKNTVKNTIITIVLLMVPVILFAQPMPGDATIGGGAAGNGPLGGCAPIGGGLVILLSLAIGYATRKFVALRKKLG